MPKKWSHVKRLICSDNKPVNKGIKRVLKHFKNIRDFSDPSQNTKEKEKGEKESKWRLLLYYL